MAILNLFLIRQNILPKIGTTGKASKLTNNTKNEVLKINISETAHDNAQIDIFKSQVKKYDADENTDKKFKFRHHRYSSL
jgi:hypothetical protein